MCHYPKNFGWQTTSSRTKRFSSCNLRSHLEMAGFAQKRIETCEILSVRVWLEMRFRMRESLSLWTSGVTRHRYAMTCYFALEFIFNTFLTHFLNICISFIHIKSTYDFYFSFDFFPLFLFLSLYYRYVTKKPSIKLNFIVSNRNYPTR